MILHGIRIPFSLFRNPSIENLQIGGTIYLKYITKDSVSDQNVFIASTEPANLDWEKNCQKDEHSLASLAATRDQWAVHKITEIPNIQIVAQNQSI